MHVGFESSLVTTTLCSLISALAAASGHKLVRINLSEQTDIADLMGSDLPMQNSTASGASFEWCDGVLLTAIKEGSWVLLDELNLASQSVLEGLNSCLDHRAEVFIPELGQTFACPASFRVFAAQNPLAQGGGRKGLPRSFLNRFTKVFVASLSDGDLRAIITSNYPSFDRHLINSMIDFNNQVHEDVVEKREYGFEGSPWEFNLRDVFRWCELLSTGSSSLENHARDLYYQRFRTLLDRDRVDLTFKKYFNKSMKSQKHSSTRMLESYVEVGDSVLERQPLLHGSPSNPLSQESVVSLSRQLSVEAVARCIACNWPCLLVGPSGSGKTSIVTSLADLCNTKLVTQCLSPSSDVTELVGCFEQVDSATEERQCLEDLCRVAEEFLIVDFLGSEEVQKVWTLLLALKKYMLDQTEAPDPFSGVFRASDPVHTMIFNLSRLLLVESENKKTLPQKSRDQLREIVSKLRQCSQAEGEKREANAAHFVWRDGTLVEAMEMGFWLLLENVNLCPSSVLDRLNSVMEKDGELLLSECGPQDTSNGESSHRRIKPHKNFRIFLSMDPVNGEVSRAMRNRCVEIAMLESTAPQGSTDPEKITGRLTMTNHEKIDCLGMLQHEGIRSIELASLILSTYANEKRASSASGEEHPCLSEVVKSSSILSGLVSRGVLGSVALRQFLQLSFQVGEETVIRHLAQRRLKSSRMQPWTALPPALPIRSTWIMNTTLKSVAWEARLLRIFLSSQSNVFSVLSYPELGLLDSPAEKSMDKQPYEFRMDTCDNAKLGDALAQLYLARATPADFEIRYNQFDGIESRTSLAIGWMGSFMKNELDLHHKQTSGESSSAVSLSIGDTWFSFPPNIRQLQFDRLGQRLREWKWLRVVSSRHSTQDALHSMRVLEASYYVHESLLDRSSVSCPVLPSLYPFFLCVDRFIYLALRDSINFDLEEELSLDPFSSFMDERDRLWCHLEECTLSASPDFVFCFEESEFIVQWKWLKKTFSRLSSERYLSIFSETTKVQMVKLEAMMDNVDRVVFGTGFGMSTRVLRKRMIRPKLPRDAKHWETIFQIRNQSEKCTVLSDQSFNPFIRAEASVNMQTLVDCYHPILFTSMEDKLQLLTALCTIHWSCTDEVQGTESGDSSLLSNLDFGAKFKALFEQKRETFIAEVARSKIDLNISTVENQFSAESLDGLKEMSAASQSSSEAYSRLGKSLLSCFQRVQMSGLAEFWCANEETRICSEICVLLLDSCAGPRERRSKLLMMLPRIKLLIDTVLTKTVWSIADMRPFQTLVWVLEGSSEQGLNVNELLRCLLPAMLFSRSRHLFVNSFVNNNVVSENLELPDTWTDDEATTYKPRPHKEDLKTDSRTPFGSGILRRQYRSEFMLRLLGKQLTLSQNATNKRIFTMENSVFRTMQYRDIAEVLSFLPVAHSTTEFQLSIADFLVNDILHALEAVQCTSEVRQLLVRLNSSLSAYKSELKPLAEPDNQKPIDPQLGRLVSELVTPMVESYIQASHSKIGSKERNEQVALASIYIGLVRLHILRPDSPLDPGREPLAKVALIDRKLAETKLRVTAIRLDRGFIQGDFSPLSSDCCRLLDDATRMAQKRESLEKKVIQRVPTAPHFSELFRETNDFIATAARSDAVLKLVHDFRRTGNRAAIHGWQRTAMAFCQRLEHDFKAFEEFVGPLITSVQMIQDGLNELIESSFDRCDDVVLETFRQLAQFPFQNHSELIKSSTKTLSQVSRQSQDMNVKKKTNCHFAVGLALLSRISLKNLESGLDGDDVAACCKVFDTLARSHLGTDESHKDESVDDEQEREYREQFPDHRKDFKELLEVDDDDRSDSDMELPDDETTGSRGILNDKQIGLLCSVHDRIFSPKMEEISDSCRTFAFHCAYGAAFELDDAYGCLKDMRVEMERLGGHVFAMSLTAAPTAGNFRVYPHLPSSSSTIDFHNDPLPSEAMLAEDPVEKLMARVTQLLTAFPGHSILLGIGRVCERVRKFDLMTTPIGKVMTGLEVVLKHSQGWEQHASNKVKLGVALEGVGRLIARWRKLELESWPSLLQARQVKHIRKTQKHWMRLHQVLFVDTMEELRESFEGGVSVLQLANFQTSSPSWIWKGISSLHSDSLPLSEKYSSEDVSELVKVLDTFVLTSSLGEFEERLRILKAYSIQLIVVYNLSGGHSSWRLHQARVLRSICSYYKQFGPFLAAKLEALRKPLEKELSEEVKLAKWDEQSYYALAESTERNHRKLMKILTKYDECLGLNVALLIQEDTCRGVRADANSGEDVTSSVPSESTMFPVSSPEPNRRQEGKHLDSTKSATTTTWVDPGQIDVESGGHIGKIEKYAKKMFSMARKGTALSDSWGSIGSDVTSSFCEAIFDRIGALRAKSTRPMKERALVDLFRELKRNGFSSTKWSVPSEARRMEQIFQLPAPSLSGIHIAHLIEPALARAEQYYFRCLVEIHAFRSEVKAHGSRHMSTRQMELMVNMGSSGVFMLAQQRCLLSGIIGDIIGLKDCTNKMRFQNPSLPRPQSILRGSICSFNRKTRSAIESVHELSLFIKSSRGLLKEDKNIWARDAIAKLESVTFAPSTPDTRVGEPELVEWKDLDSLGNDVKKLAKAESVVQDCYESCKSSGCLPRDVFDAPMIKISEAIKTGENCKASLEGGHGSNSSGSSLGSFGEKLSTAVERALISFQSFSSEASSSKEDEESDGGYSADAAIWDCHKNLSNAWKEINLTSLSSSMKSALRLLCDQLDHSQISEKDAEVCLGLASNANILSEHVLSLAETLVEDSVQFFAVAAKLNYILLRLYRVLVAKGFCSDKVSEDDSGDADGDINGMTFEDDQEGTGMGEGEGKNDVTDQLESEEQLLGLKSDNDNGDEEERESKKLNEDEAEQGMEMENDFDGETFDLPEKEDDNNDDDNDEEGEELDRQMGEGPTPDEQVVDERMWNESDDEDEINEDEEKFEKDTNVGGEAIEGATHTKDDDKDEKGPENAPEKSADLAKEDGKENEGGETENDPEEIPNNDDDDQYEDSHGVEVRDEGKEETQNADEDDDGMDIEDDLCLDGEDGEDEQPSDQNENIANQDEVDDSQSVDSQKEGEGDTEPMPEDENEDLEESGDAQPVPISEADLEAKEDDQEDGGGIEESIKEDPVNNTDHQSAAEGAHGIQGSEGIDTVMEDDQEGGSDQQGEDNEAGTSGNSQSKMSESNGDGGEGYSDRNEKMDQLGDTQAQEKSLDVPNPFRNPGDASKFWHRKLNVVEASEDHAESMDTPAEDNESHQGDDGEFQFSSDQQGTTQVLGETTEEEAVELDPQNQEETLGEEKKKKKEKTEPPQKDISKANPTASLQTKKETTLNQTPEDENNQGSDNGDDGSASNEEIGEENDDVSEASDIEKLDQKLTANMVVSDMSNLFMDVDEIEETVGARMLQDEQVSGISSAEAAEARARWLQIQGETHSLSRRLCEKLRLVMEPLVASKLRGDYRTGKRINMKRVISYIASGYRKDKIWLKRTKPAKRDYRVLLAVDDSESMRKSGAGEMALRAMATLAIGMNQLEIGELGVASFGDDMKLLHPFHLPFTSEAGADMVMNCKFDQPRTRISLCVESAIASLESFGDNSSMQLVFLISDGRIERDSRASVKRLVREMVERNILLAMIIVEGENKKKDSIINMKEVTFEKGKPVVKQFIDDYPFPYYIVLEDLTTLPEVMGDALRQWFEMLAQLKQN
jgi:MoxR-like ATPase